MKHPVFTSRSFAATVRFVAALLAGVMISAHAAAQNMGNTFSDLWWNPAESGWGVTINHQQDMMFLTFFLYRADGSPHWVAAELQKVGTNPLTSPPVVFTGTVYETSGPAFGVPFNPAAVTDRVVGTATFTVSDLSNAALQYSIDGVTVTKNITRQTLRTVNYSGEYLGGTSYVLSKCANPALNNKAVANLGTLSVTHNGDAITIVARGQAATCTFNGTYMQKGSLGGASGSYSCSDGTGGSFNLAGMQWTIFGMAAAIDGSSQSCSFNGLLGGITDDHI